MFHQHFLENLSMDNSPELIIYLAATLSRVAKYAKSDKQLAALLILINELLTNYSNGKCELNGTLNSLRW